jgi:hypothetical protein
MGGEIGVDADVDSAPGSRLVVNRRRHWRTTQSTMMRTIYGATRKLRRGENFDKAHPRRFVAIADIKTVVRDLTSSMSKNFLISGIQSLNLEQLAEPTNDHQGS